MIIGSTALQYHFEDFWRKPKDKDVIGEVIKGADNLKDIPCLQKTDIIGKNELYTLKCSHSFWDLPNGSWRKHMYDIQMMKDRGCELIPDLFWKLYNFWLSLNGPHKKSNLKLSSDEFFNNALASKYNHDYLHEVLITHPYFEGQSGALIPKLA